MCKDGKAEKVSESRAVVRVCVQAAAGSLSFFFSSRRILAAFTDSVSSLDFSRNASRDRKSTRLNSSHVEISYAVFCLKKKKKKVQKHQHQHGHNQLANR